ncbi:MAG: methyl-accepting chemotaxis protein [Nitrospiraceae bacterium]|nr:methyl-accepting chemotaxis protein [Nitrospiraceae bacterium]MCE5312907.1 methyl-accepting chemotaxis protein [Nitrospiraceae bacterium]
MGILRNLSCASLKCKIMVPLIAIFALTAVLIVLWTGAKIEDVSTEQGKKDLVNMSEAVFGVMTGYMATGTISNSLPTFVEHMNKMLPLRVIRDEALDAQFGKKKPEDYLKDDFEKEVFKNKKPAFRMQEIKGKPYLVGVFPYVAVKNYMGTDCLSCHAVGVKEGDVIGAVSIGLNMEKALAEVSHTKLMILLLVSLLSAVSIVIIYFVVTGALITPLNTIVAVIQKAAQKDFRESAKIHYDDEIGNVADAVNKMSEGLALTISDIAVASSDLSEAAGSLNKAIEATVKTTSKQAGQSMHIASISEEMAQTVTEIARNSASASDSAKEAISIADAGKEVVSQSVERIISAGEATKELSSMIQHLNSKVGEIGEIVSVISDIADQTNLLALNAAIEAARAGEQGRGFAIVADEVRKLAERTAKATNEISEKIQGVQDDSERTGASMQSALDHVSDGVEYMEKAKGSLDKIVDSVKKTAQEITHIAASVEEQSVASEEIAKNIEEVSVMATETKQTSESLMELFDRMNTLSDALKTTIASFKFK